MLPQRLGARLGLLCQHQSQCDQRALLHKVHRIPRGGKKGGRTERVRGSVQGRKEDEGQAAVMSGRTPAHTNRGTANKDASVDRSLDQRLQQHCHSATAVGACISAKRGSSLT